MWYFVSQKTGSVDYIKRVIGTPGDTIEIKDKKVFINGEPIDDPHAQFSSSAVLSAGASPRDNLGPIVVPEQPIFVMGDNQG